MTPVVIRNGPSWIRVPAQFRMAWQLPPPDLLAAGIEQRDGGEDAQRPKVTMNGGRLSRVTKVPLRNPAKTPQAIPISRASTPGTPLLAARLAMTNEDKMAIAPTDRSMPAVRMTSVWPIAKAAITATCCRMMPMVLGGKARVEDGEDDEGQQQDQQGADRGVRVQEVLDPLDGRLLPRRELFGRARRSGRLDGGGHIGLLAVVDKRGSAQAIAPAARLAPRWRRS